MSEQSDSRGPRTPSPTPRLVVSGERGVALVVDGQVVGAIGVSGGSSQEDREVAEAGAAALSTGSPS